MTTPQPFTAIVLAAGAGKRMNSDTAKVLHPVAGKPLLAWVIDAIKQTSATTIIVVVGHDQDAVCTFLNDRYDDPNIKTVYQKEQRGTGHAVRMALSCLEQQEDQEIVSVLSGDVPFIASSQIDQLVSQCRDVTSMSLVTMKADAKTCYGRLVRNNVNDVERIVEYVDATDTERQITEMNAGCYAIQLGVLKKTIQDLSKENVQGEEYITDIVQRVAQQSKLSTIEASLTEMQGINDHIELAQGEMIAQQKINRFWMEQGVTLLSPHSIWIDADVGPIAPDVSLASGVVIRGKTSIGARTHIDVGSVIESSELGEDVHVFPYSVVIHARLDKRAQVGPFSHVRSQTHLHEDTCIGNFVEVKKTSLGTGSKAKHLAYLGDADIGSRTNIGAGTITCNYNGTTKEKTIIGDDVFIGSGTQFIAPVTIASEAYVASGTTVTEDVPKNSLAIGRIKQQNKLNVAARLKQKHRFVKK